jgi:hypothetical protein
MSKRAIVVEDRRCLALEIPEDVVPCCILVDHGRPHHLIAHKILSKVRQVCQKWKYYVDNMIGGIVEIQMDSQLNTHLTNECLHQFHSLKKLDLSSCRQNITYDMYEGGGLQCLTNLKHMCLGRFTLVSCISKATQLTSLDLAFNRNIRFIDISHMSNINTLYINIVRTNYEHSLAMLTNITKLTIGGMKNNILPPTLLSLVIRNTSTTSDTVRDQTIQSLTNLTNLCIYQPNAISNDGIKDLVSLTSLTIAPSYSFITGPILKVLTNLTTYNFYDYTISKEFSRVAIT